MYRLFLSKEAPCYRSAERYTVQSFARYLVRNMCSLNLLKLFLCCDIDPCSECTHSEITKCKLEELVIDT